MRELIRLGDQDEGITLAIRDRFHRGSLPWHDYLKAEFSIFSRTLQAKFTACLSPGDIDDWEQCLIGLAQGSSAKWLYSGMAPEIQINPRGAGADFNFSANDPGMRADMKLWIPSLETSLATLAALLEDVRSAFPRETTETAPGVYEWLNTAGHD